MNKKGTSFSFQFTTNACIHTLIYIHKLTAHSLHLYLKSSLLLEFSVWLNHRHASNLFLLFLTPSKSTIDQFTASKKKKKELNRPHSNLSLRGILGLYILTVK